MPKSLATVLRSKGAGVKRKTVWKGPQVDGITQSLLSRFIVCPERFRVLVIEGLKPAEKFNARLEYGNLWHACEEAIAAGRPWEVDLKNAARRMVDRYRMDGPEITKWYNVCKTQFPFYLKYWNASRGGNRTPIFEEKAFAVPYQLPSRRTVLLRGKFDSVDLISSRKTADVWLQENKTKGDIDEQQLQRQLKFDLQTMLYLVALGNMSKEVAEIARKNSGFKTIVGTPVGVRYNVIRRPLSGGKGSIRKHQPSKSNPHGETDDQFYSRLGEYFREDPGYWFMRWNVRVSPQDVDRFCTTFLDPVLERLCSWWEHITGQNGAHSYDPAFTHYRFPYGVYNPMLEGNVSDVDNYLDTGDSTGLQRTENLFPELTDAQS